MMLKLLPTKMRTRRALRRLPESHAISRLTGPERNAFYVHAVKAAWEDGKLRFEERLFLDRLRSELGLDEKVGQRLEERAYAAR